MLLFVCVDDALNAVASFFSTTTTPRMIFAPLRKAVHGEGPVSHGGPVFRLDLGRCIHNLIDPGRSHLACQCAKTAHWSSLPPAKGVSLSQEVTPPGSLVWYIVRSGQTRKLVGPSYTMLLPEEQIIVKLEPDANDYEGPIQLESYIHHSARRNNIGVIISHPYGPLGGDLYNNVVRHVTHAMSSMGFSTLRYNMRGVGQSNKKTSWTGQPESLDLLQLMHWWTSSHTHTQGSFVDPEGIERPRCAPTRLIVIGYSYGAMISLPALARFPALVASVSIALPTRVVPLLSCFHTAFFTPLLPRTLPKLFLLGDSDVFSSSAHALAFLETLCGVHEGKLNADVMFLRGLDHFMLGKEQQVVEPLERWVKNIVKQCS